MHSSRCTRRMQEGKTSSKKYRELQRTPHQVRKFNPSTFRSFQHRKPLCPADISPKGKIALNRVALSFIASWSLLRQAKYREDIMHSSRCTRRMQERGKLPLKLSGTVKDSASSAEYHYHC